ncbi:type-2 ice-structuring protein-like isoform X2 [Micropterus salmoides]|uniref:type-2 ice-structuring protein-like isoform X2 n=1 Tax=Micropterus salmoides TaxID=27706 RepID=UPI0018EC7E38|nr:type-2 ice-structuring protein-like isoform X2 [Micropterus salmoides]
MKTLILSALLCAVITLTRAAGEHHILERSTSCPSGWTKISGRCFLFVPRTMTWAQAERNCLSLGANLASVRGAEEYHGIKRLVADKTHGNSQTWLGGSDSEEERVWFWSDGTPFTFSYWCRGEPNNDGYQHCLQMNYGGDKCWDDTKCHYHLQSVCVKKTT